MKKKLLVVALGLSSSIALVGCGSGGDEIQDPVTSVFYTVKVIDGYLKNAQVWLDIDGDKQLDSNEPLVFSGDSGIAKLDVTNIVSPEQYSIYAKVIFGQTIDEDNGAVASDYIMSAPPGETDITPLSTLVDIYIEQNTDGTESVAVLAAIKQAAIDKVAYDFGIQETDVLSDYIASGTGSATFVAENIANSQILPDDENEFIVVIADNSDTSTFNKQVAAASGMIKAVVGTTAEEDFDTQAAVFDSEDDYDTDSDGDGVPDALDALDDDASEWLDTDGDGIGNNADPDDDDDGVEDSIDADPLDPTVGEYDDCVVNYTPTGASIDDFNAQLASCDLIPEMDLAGNSIIRILDSDQTRMYTFNLDNTAPFYQNGVQYNRIWEINDDGNLALYYGDGLTLDYLMRLIDDTEGNLKFGVYANSSQSIYTWNFTDVDLSVDILACEDLDSGRNYETDLPLAYRSYDEFKQAVTSCQAGKLFTAFSTGFISSGMTLTTSDAVSQADDVDTYQFNENGSGVFTYNEGADDIIVPMTWTMHEDDVVKVVIDYIDGDSLAQTAHNYLAIIETNGIDYSVKVFSRSTAFEGLGDAAGGDLWSTVLNVPDDD
ncbi:hypothetical protein [Moritella sp.]|uniref:hypothetical protein n=1 Tax=Moritella sp. TaxID=78556 RepID=UPI001DE559DC|nr:hypothetical protein [Moritella sp.]MCJ8348760.1 hypothetical protein [Moritella sp.]NQZ38636.1 hypothetical protein [Moritella sp.]